HLIYYEYRLDDLIAAKRSGQIALELQKPLKVVVPTIYSHMGLVSSALGEYHEALRYYQMSIKTERMAEIKLDENMLTGYVNLGTAYHDLSMFKSALYWCEKMALRYQLELLPADHPTLSITYSNISSIYSSMGDHKLARSNLEKALEIQKAGLPPLHF